jgi:hypothetical protein
LIAIFAALPLATAAYASDVRILALPDSVLGAWAPDTDACNGSGTGKIDIAPKSHSTADMSCQISWITVTASRDGPVYSARSNCSRTTGGPADAKEPPSYLVISPRTGDTLVVRRTDGNTDGQLVTYRKCQ